MRPRRWVALLLLVSVGTTSVEILLGEEHPAEGAGVGLSAPATAAAAVLGTPSESAPAEDQVPDDCTCLCACACVNAQVVVTATPVEPPSGLCQPASLTNAMALFLKRARARPDLRPPLA